MPKTVVVTYDEFTKRARHIAYQRKVSLVVAWTEWRTSNGKWVREWADRNYPPLAARVCLKINGHEIHTVAVYAEFFQDIVTSPGWEDYVKAGLIARVAEVMALRTAFPDEFQDVLIEEELGKLPKTPYTAEDFPEYRKPTDKD